MWIFIAVNLEIFNVRGIDIRVVRKIVVIIKGICWNVREVI